MAFSHFQFGQVSPFRDYYAVRENGRVQIFQAKQEHIDFPTVNKLFIDSYLEQNFCVVLYIA